MDDMGSILRWRNSLRLDETTRGIEQHVVCQWQRGAVISEEEIRAADSQSPYYKVGDQKDQVTVDFYGRRVISIQVRVRAPGDEETFNNLYTNRLDEDGFIQMDFTVGPYNRNIPLEGGQNLGFGMFYDNKGDLPLAHEIRVRVIRKQTPLEAEFVCPIPTGYHRE